MGDYMERLREENLNHIMLGHNSHEVRVLAATLRSLFQRVEELEERVRQQSNNNGGSGE